MAATADPSGLGATRYGGGDGCGPQDGRAGPIGALPDGRVLRTPERFFNRVVARSRNGFEPPCAVYSKTRVTPAKERIGRRKRQVLDHRLIAVVSDDNLSLPVPVLPLDHPGPVCDFLEQRFLGGA